MSPFLSPKVSDTIEQQLAQFASERTTKPQGMTRPQNMQRAISLRSWFKSIFPSQRHERGWTLRERGFHEQLATEEQNTVQRQKYKKTESYYSAGCESADSNQLRRWNTAKDLSEDLFRLEKTRQHAISTRTEEIGPQGRAQDDEPEFVAPVTELGGILQGVSNGTSKPSGNNTSCDRAEFTSKFVNSQELFELHQYEAKREARRQRRRLKASGDYLGVQGANPQTGQPDIITPTDSSEISPEVRDAQFNIDTLQQESRSAESALDKERSRGDKTAQLISPDRREGKLCRRKGKKKDVAENNSRFDWKRHKKQWSSAQEPELSPICQSLRSTTPISRKQSHVPVGNQTKLFKGGRPSELSPPRTPEHLARPPSEETIASAGSSETVFRTPHRRSVARHTLTSWEILKNGLSINASHAPSDPSDYATANEAESSQMTPNAHSHPVHMNDTGKDLVQPNFIKVEPHEEGSFLDQQPTAKADPKDGVESIKSLDGEATACCRWSHQPTAKDNIVLLPKKNDIDPLSSKMLCSFSKNVAQDSGVCQMSTSMIAASHKRVTQNPTPSLSFDRGLFRKFKPHLTSLRGMKGKKDIISTRQEPKSQAYFRQSGQKVPEMPRTLTARMPGNDRLLQASLTGVRTLTRPSTKLTGATVQNDMAQLRKQIAILDGLEFLPKSWNQHQTSGEWTETTIQEIINKGGDVKEESVCIPIITTIGCDQREIALNPDHAFKEETGGNLAQRKRPPRRTLYNAPVENKSRNSWEICQARTLQSISQNLEERSILTATTHTRQQPAEILMNYSDQEAAELAITDSQRNTLRRSTYICYGKPTGSSASIQIRDLDVEDIAIEDQIAASWQSSQSMEKRQVIQRQQIPPKRAENARETNRGTGEMCLDCADRDLKLLARYPGSYPAHLDVKDATENRFDSPEAEIWSLMMHKKKCWGMVSSQIKGRGMWDTVKELPFLVFIHGTVMLSLYWRIVGPVFHYRSKYWKMYGRHGATLQHIATFSLAIPGALFGFTALV